MLKFNNEYIKYLSRQRTEIKNINDESITKTILADYEICKNHIPETTKKWLDIGAGLGLINIFIYKQLSGGKMYLLDKSLFEENKRLIGFGTTESFGFYTDLNASKELLILNGVVGEDINLLEPEIFKNIPDGDLDLIISRISWCFHYPYKTYSELVHSKLKSQGRLIIDIRKESPAYQEVIKDNRYIWKEISNRQKIITMLGIKK